MSFHISKIGEEAIKECRNHGVELTDENIITIYELGKIADYDICSGLRYYTGKKVGNIVVYPLTMGARLWLEYEAKELCKLDENMYGWSMIWAFCHANDSDKFEFKTYKELKKAITKWGKRISCTDEELNEALADIGGIVLEGQEAKKEDLLEDSKDKLSPILNLLMTNYGKDFEYWLWEINEDVCHSLIREYVKHNNQKKTVISNDDVAIKAFLKLKSYIYELKETVKPSEPSEPTEVTEAEK